jgi:hypothetical protein
MIPETARRCKQCRTKLPAGAPATQRFCCDAHAFEHRRHPASFCTKCRCKLLRPALDGMCGFCSPSFDLEAELAIHSPSAQGTT